MSVTTTSQTKAAALALVQALIAGTEKHFPNGSFTLGNVTYTTASLVQELQSLVDPMLALNVAQQGAKDALKATQGAEAKVGPVVRAYKRFVLAAFSNAAQTLADFGLTPPKARAPMTVEQKAAAAAKAKATRTARGTTSKKKKLAVKGNVTGVTVTPITSPSPGPAPSAQQVTAPQGTPATAGIATK
jgi:hypothetical protein